MTDINTIAQLYSGRLGPIPPKIGQASAAIPKGGASFQNILDSQLLTFSHHAEQRLNQRGIHLQPDHLQRLEGAIDKAAAKGAKDSLVLFDDMAFIVNVKNRTVVTAMDGASMSDHVFTKIDSTIVVR